MKKNMLGKHENMSNFEVVHITNIYKKDTKNIM